MEGDGLLFNGIILTCTEVIKDTRSSSAIYHLLTGKKGIQTVHDARLFELERFYGIYPGLDKKIFTDRMDDLTTEGYLIRSKQADHSYLLSPFGKDWLIHHQAGLPFDDYNGFSYSKMDNEFYQGILLLIQTYTNSYKQHFSFIPLIDNRDVTQSIKAIYRVHKKISDAKMLEGLYDELYHVLRKTNPLAAKLFVDRLTGYKDYGLSISQLAIAYDLSKEDVQLFLVAVVHLFITEVKQNKLPILSQLLQYCSMETSFITASAEKTNAMMQLGMTIEEIAERRKLKQNTIYDHIVEMALIDSDFSIKPYVSEHEFQAIESAVHTCKSLKLKTIKKAVDHQISYFQIRLSLTRIHLSKSDERREVHDKTTDFT